VPEAPVPLVVVLAPVPVLPAPVPLATTDPPQAVRITSELRTNWCLFIATRPHEPCRRTAPVGSPLVR
jgi:hypothetical protein